MERRIYNESQLARELGVDRGTVTRWRAAGCPAVRHGGKSKGSAWAYELPAVLGWLLERARAEGRAGHERSTLTQIERARAQVELELAELRLAELSGLVVRVDDVLEVMGADYDLIRKALRSVPARIGPDLWLKVTAGGTEADVVSDLESELDDVLANLSGEQRYGGTGTGSTAPATNGSGRIGKAAPRRRARAKREAAAAAKADAKRVGGPKPQLSDEASAEPGRWVTGRAEYLRKIMDACTDRRVEEVVLQKSAQIGGTEVLLNLCGFHMDQDPALILVVQPSLELVDDWSKARLATMIRDTPCLQDKVTESKSRDSGNRIREKRFPGGRITIAGANSVRSLRGRPMHIIACDDVDGFPASAGTEGDPIALVRKRATTFRRIRKPALTPLRHRLHLLFSLMNSKCCIDRLSLPPICPNSADDVHACGGNFIRTASTDAPRSDAAIQFGASTFAAQPLPTPQKRGSAGLFERDECPT